MVVDTLDTTISRINIDQRPAAFSAVVERAPVTIRWLIDGIQRSAITTSGATVVNSSLSWKVDAGNKHPTGTYDARSIFVTPRPDANIVADDGYPPESSAEALALMTTDENCEITCKQAIVN